MIDSYNITAGLSAENYDYQSEWMEKLLADRLVADLTEGGLAGVVEGRWSKEWEWDHHLWRLTLSWTPPLIVRQRCAFISREGFLRFMLLEPNRPAPLVGPAWADTPLLNISREVKPTGKPLVENGECWELWE